MTAATDSLLWVDKYRPATFDDLSFHDDLTDRLRHLASTMDMPHLLLYGPSGAGKRTRAGCVLRHMFGGAVDKKRVVHRVFKVGDTSKQVEVTTVASAHHIEVNPSESGLNDRLVIQELIKDMASTAPMPLSVLMSASSSATTNTNNNNNNISNTNTDKEKDKDKDKENKNHADNSHNQNGNVHVKVIVLHEVDKMTRLAQQALRRTMERYAATCRIIMVSDNVSGIIEPLRSRVLGVRVGLPDFAQVCKVLDQVIDQEGLTVDAAFKTRLFESSGRGNLRRALLQLEATRVSVGSLVIPADASILLGDWEYACDDAARLLTRNQSAQQLIAVRKCFQDLLSHAVPPQIILHTLTKNILKIADDEITPEICRVAAKFDRNLAKGTKPIFHLEAFAARFMQIYAQFFQKQAAMMD